jgi:hypothetical protein
MDTRLGELAHSFSQRRTWIAVGLGVILMFAGIALWRRGRKESTQSAAVTSLPKQPARLAMPGTGSVRRATGDAAEEAAGDAHGPQFDATTCWQELHSFDEAVSLQTFRSWAAALLASNDDHVLSYLKERLTELIGADAGRASEVLSWVQGATGKEAGVFLSALRGSEAVQLPQVAEKLTAMGLDSSLSVEQRAGVLAALDTQKHFEPAVIGRLAELAKEPNSGEAGWAATRTLGRVMATDYKRTGRAAPYLDRLLSIGLESTDDDVRYLAVSMPMHTDPLLDKPAMLRYAKILTTEGSANGRDAAANIMALSQDKAKVLEIFAQAFRTDTDVCVRWALFRFAARTAAKEALPVMADMATVDPRFQPDYQVFEQIYASGVVDFERVWLSLPDQDPHGCLHRPD